MDGKLSACVLLMALWMGVVGCERTVTDPMQLPPHVASIAFRGPLNEPNLDTTAGTEIDYELPEAMAKDNQGVALTEVWLSWSRTPEFGVIEPDSIKNGSGERSHFRFSMPTDTVKVLLRVRSGDLILNRETLILHGR